MKTAQEIEGLSLVPTPLLRPVAILPKVVYRNVGLILWRTAGGGRRTFLKSESQSPQPTGNKTVSQGREMLVSVVNFVRHAGQIPNGQCPSTSNP